MIDLLKILAIQEYVIYSHVIESIIDFYYFPEKYDYNQFEFIYTKAELSLELVILRVSNVEIYITDKLSGISIDYDELCEIMAEIDNPNLTAIA